jgi:hypothetical protein
MSFKWITSIAFCTLALLLIVGCGGGSSSSSSGPSRQDEFRSVATGSELDSRARNVDSQVINSQTELEDFISAKELSHWNSGVFQADQADPFLKSLREANVNFDREALVLLRHTTPDATRNVSLDLTANPPYIDAKTFVATIQVRPGGGGVAAPITHVIAVAVSRANVNAVRVPVIYSDAAGTQTLETINLSIP